MKTGKKKVSWAALVALAVVATVTMSGCVSMMAERMIASAANAKGAANVVFLHSDPQIGDYAEMDVTVTVQQATGAQRQREVTRQEIIDRTESTVTILSTQTGQLAHVVQEIEADLDGNVLSVVMINTETDQRTQLRVAVPGDEGFLEYLYTPSDDVITIAGEEHPIEYALDGGNVSTFGGESTYLTALWLTDAIPFRVVKSIMVADLDPAEFDPDNMPRDSAARTAELLKFGFGSDR